MLGGYATNKQQHHSRRAGVLTEDGQDTNVHENGTGHAVEMSEVKVEEKVKDTVKENSEKKQEDPKAGRLVQSVS